MNERELPHVFFAQDAAARSDPAGCACARQWRPNGPVWRSQPPPPCNGVFDLHRPIAGFAYHDGHAGRVMVGLLYLVALAILIWKVARWWRGDEPPVFGKDWL